jgi:flagellar protein FliO/FliZ
MTSALSVLWFIVILAAIPLCLWLLKRSPYGAVMGAAPAGVQQPVRIVGGLAIGPGQRLLTVEVGQGDARQWLVLGVTGQAISTLHTMAPQAELPQAAAQPAFAALLKRMQNRSGGGDA